MVLTREKASLLVWDDNGWLYLLNGIGSRQAQMRMPGTLVTATAADDGSAYLAVGNQGEAWWLAPDLTLRSKQAIGPRVLAAAVDSFGQYLAVAGAGGELDLFDRYGRLLFHNQTARPLHHLAFVPASPFLLGCAEYGLVVCLNLTGHCVWRDGLVAHVGSLTVSGRGDRVILACFTEGLQRYSLAGKNIGRLPVSEPCRLAAVTYDGRLVLVAGLSKGLVLLNDEGEKQCAYQMEKPALALAYSPLGDRAVAALSDGRIIGLEVHAA
jgi:hypothetical protein